MNCLKEYDFPAQLSWVDWAQWGAKFYRYINIGFFHNWEIGSGVTKPIKMVLSVHLIMPW